MCWLQHAALLRHYPQFLLPVLALLGLAECVAGFSLWGFFRGTAGVLIGAFAGAMFCMVLLHNPILAVAGLLVGAVAGAVLFVTIEPLGTFCIGLSTGGSCAWIILAAAELPINSLTSAIIALAALATAGGVVLGGKRAIIILTALAGAQQLAAITAAFVSPTDGGPTITVPEAALLATLALTGLAIQFAVHHPHHAPPKAA